MIQKPVVLIPSLPQESITTTSLQNYYNINNTDTPDLESEESSAQRNNQIPTLSASGIKILRPSQMLRQLPIALTQVQAGNKSQKLKNEIKKLLYSFSLKRNN